MTTNWEKFKLLMWKNWLLTTRHKGQLLVELLVPLVFSGVLVMIRSLVHPTEIERITRYPRVDTETYLETFRSEMSKLEPQRQIPFELFKLAYTPNTALSTEKMTEINTLLGLSVIPVAFNTPKEMQSAVYDNTYLAGIEMTFINDRSFAFAIRFPGQCRFGKDIPIIRNWNTGLNFPRSQYAGPRNPTDDFGGSPAGYVEEGFIAIQIALYKVFFCNPEMPKIYLQRYPYPKYTDDTLLAGMEHLISLMIMLSFVYPAVNTVKFITQEKENQLKEAMKIVGVPNWLQWCAWFVRSMVCLIISSVLIVIMLTYPWQGGKVAVFTYSSFMPLLMYMTVYSIATTAFCFMISVFFAKASTAAAVSGLLWFITYSVFTFTSVSYALLPLPLKMFLSLLSNAGMAFGFQIIVKLEQSAIGIHWHNVNLPVSSDDKMTLAHCIASLFLASFLYLLVAFYVERVYPGDYGIPEKWNYPFTKQFWWQGSQPKKAPSVVYVENTNRDRFEVEPSKKEPGIQICSLRKTFNNDKIAVNDLNLKMYNDQITVLLGHNGAGKTTTMSMLTGMIPPTSGTALVSGKDIRTDMVGIRQSLGLCPQHNILFDELTVEEHLAFYGRLKGVPKDDLQEEILTYLTLIDLKDKRSTQSQRLSGGMKRKLSVCIAFCGDSKVVLLDEPTSGMDPQARRALWDVIQEEKRGRTVLLSTHFMDEADILGDRIAIMGMGVIQCCGSPFFLKKKLGAGYHLICVKDDQCDSAKVTERLRQYVPDAAVESDIGTELSYLFIEQDVSKFRVMFEMLEENLSELRLISFGVSLTTLEEVFMSVGTDPMTKKVEKRASSMFRIDENLSTPMDNLYLRTGATLVAYQYVALFRKKFLQTLRHWFLLFVQICIPLIFTTITVMSERGRGVFNDLPRLHIQPKSYSHIIGVLESDNDQTDYVQEYKQASVEIKVTQLDFEDFVENNYAHNAFLANNHYFFGATLRSPDNMTAWFNNQPYHAAPLSVRMLFDAILRKECGADWSMDIVNAPRPYTAAERTSMTQFGLDMGFQLALNMDMAMAFVAAFYVLTYIKERMCRSKLLQLVSGVRIITYWMVNLVWDMLTFQLTVIALLLLFVAFQEQGWSSAVEMFRIYLILIFFSWGFLPNTYFFSLFFKEPASGFTRVSIIYIVTGMACFFVVFVLQLPMYGLEDTGHTLIWYFLVFPHFALSYSLNNINKLGIREALCNINCDGIEGCDKDTNMCELISACCDFDYFAFEDPGIGRNLMYLFFSGIAWFVILFAMEYKWCDYLPERPAWMTFKRKKSKPAMVATRTTSSMQADSDVMRENALVQDMQYGEIAQKSLVLRDLHKTYGDFQAVNSLSVAINSYETFGLLGVNGAGKTTTFKMLTGDESITSGDAWLKGVSHRLNMNTVHKSIGYCPQFDALFEELTGREHLEIYCRLRGIPKDEIPAMLNDLAIELNLDKHLDKRACQYSGGNKRKLSTALALIGHPVVVYLDEPTTGMDPGAKRCLWNVVNSLRKTGKTIVLTSHSMDECEALCTRLVIMVNGEFKCIGSVQHLKNKFSRGFSLTVKVKLLMISSSSMDIQSTSKTKGFRQRISQFIGKRKNRMQSIDEINLKPIGTDELKEVVKFEDNSSFKLPQVSAEDNRFPPQVSIGGQTTHYLRDPEFSDPSSGSLVPNRRRVSHRLSVVPMRDLQLVKDFIADHLPNSELTEELRGVLTFFIPASATLKWSHLFGVMEMAKAQFPIEDYSISQTSLEQVFLSFTRQQRED